jgi:hypothetical protein
MKGLDPSPPVSGDREEGRRHKKKLAAGRQQPIEKAHFGRENPRKSKFVQTSKGRQFAEPGRMAAEG